MLIAQKYDDALVAPPRIDARSRLDFRLAALEHLERAVQRKESQFVIDMRHTTDIDASGFGVLLLVQKRARERMLATKLSNAPAFAKQMIAQTMLEYLFEIED
jgi:anti-anti-sigma regulatory factor